MRVVCCFGVLLGLLVVLTALVHKREPSHAEVENVPVSFSMNMTIFPNCGGFFLPGSSVDVILVDAKARDAFVIMENVLLTKIDPIGYYPLRPDVQAVLNKLPLLGEMITRNSNPGQYVVELQLLPKQVRQIVAAQARGELVLSLVPPQEDTANEGSDD